MNSLSERQFNMIRLLIFIIPVTFCFSQNNYFSQKTVKKMYYGGEVLKKNYVQKEIANKAYYTKQTIEKTAKDYYVKPIGYAKQALQRRAFYAKKTALSDDGVLGKTSDAIKGKIKQISKSTSSEVRKGVSKIKKKSRRAK